jgi:hypothetical protein
MRPTSLLQESGSRSAIVGRYALFHAGIECGEERWRMEAGASGWVLTGAQELQAPHPMPNRQEYRAVFTSEGRPASLEIRWYVGPRVLAAMHHADGAMWRVRIEYGDQLKEQQGDFPLGCEVDYGTHLFDTMILARRDFQIGGEHEFPALRIGPPWMAVTPDRMVYRCVEQARIMTALGPADAKRYVVSLPSQDASDGYSFWADDDGIVLESYEGDDPGRPWMRLVELRSEALT